MSEAALLRTLADKLDEMEAVTTYPAEITDPGQITVAWTEQEDHPGYSALSEAISKLVGQHWNALRSQVVKQREGEVQAARAALATVNSVDRPSSAISPSMEASLRKVAS
jgi:hypothetical protein